MKIELTNEKLEVVLEGKEKLWSLKKRLSIPADQISNIEWMSGKINRSRLHGLRAPGTGVPGLFYAGSIYRKAGWEFWYLNARQPGYLVITTDQKKYRVIRVTVSEEMGQEVQDWFENLDE